ncbi:L-seryl-tRNA(Sec) selenium transferase [Candidatus Methanoperedenaceae archaeon GB37]|nr:L-seryl-tRNA(Sec) selenium transferase [Candidatus Methanoperedenaceae archaeon GB37]
MFLTLNTLACGKKVIVSRGELIEIGGSFRIPDVMARSGAILTEVGTTNRTHIYDYEQAIDEQTALIMKVHKSNYKIIGFTKEVGLEELVTLGQKHNLPVIEDLGSGNFVDLTKYGLEKEPLVQKSIAAGVDIVSFSGDKLLGGPQAGIILGKRKFIEPIKKNPLNRALRIDKLTLAGLESTLRLYQDEKQALKEIPTLRLLTFPPAYLRRQAFRLKKLIQNSFDEKILKVGIKRSVSKVGGGALPGQELPTFVVVIKPAHISVLELEQRLRVA